MGKTQIFWCGVTCLLAAACGSEEATDASRSGDLPDARDLFDGGATSAGGASSGDGGVHHSAGASGVGGSDQGFGDAGEDAPASCDIAKSPLDVACIVSDEFAVFVNAGASGTGSREDPIGTIGAGIDLARKAGKIVIVCNADYDENLVVARGSMGVRAYGGFACPGSPNPWKPDPSTRARIAPTHPGFGLVVDDVFGDVVFSNIDIAARDAIEPGTSSIAVRVSGSMNVWFEGLTIAAGHGAEGGRGQDGFDTADEPDATSDQQGTDAACPPGPVPQVRLAGFPIDANSCGSQGGFGGNSTTFGRGDDGQSGVPYLVGNNGVAGLSIGADGEAGGDGARGVDGILGKAASPEGTFSENGFTPSDGGSGTDGWPGQGGGGGGASFGGEGCVGASGGAGGRGSCGSGGAVGGGGGGASVGLLVWDSSVMLASVKIVAQDGGNGGEGGDGGLPGRPGRGGSGGRGLNSVAAIGWGGRGGFGGPGGRGGSGAGGTGGPSHALIVHGEMPNQLDVTMKTSSGGLGGKGGVVRTTVDINPAPDGLHGKNDLVLVAP